MVKGRRLQEITLLRNLMYTTIRIEVDGDYGTGFFYHVKYEDEHGQVDGANTVEMVFHLGPESYNMPPGGTYEYTINNPGPFFISHPNADIDLWAIKIDEMLERIEKETSRHPFYEAFSMFNVTIQSDELSFFLLKTYT